MDTMYTFTTIFSTLFAYVDKRSPGVPSGSEIVWSELRLPHQHQRFYEALGINYVLPQIIEHSAASFPPKHKFAALTIHTRPDLLAD